ncbi:PepSY-associated TM helix domain-containing protein [Dietzia sp. NPDC055343]
MSVAPTTAEHARPPKPTRPARTTGPVAEQLRAILARIHFYAGLFVAPFLIVAALSGALYAMSPTLEKLAYQDQISATTTTTTTSTPLAEQIAAARDRQPGLDLVEVWPADEPGIATRVLFADDSLPEGVNRAVFVDPADASVNGVLTSYSGVGELPVRSWISGLHSDLHLGTAGAIYSELAASWLLILTLSGLFLWWRKTRTARSARRAAMLRGVPGRPGTRRKTMSLHATLGTWFAAILLGIATTGLTWSTYTGGNIDSVVSAMNWRSDPLQTSISGDAATADAHTEHRGHSAQHAGHRSPTEQAPSVLDAARHAGLDGPLRMSAPADADSAWTVSQLWGPWVFSSDSVAVSGDDGRIVDRLDFGDLSPYSKLSSWGIYLHMGIMFGLPLQIALAATALAVVALAISGYRMWWKRRPTRGGLPAPLGKTAGLTWQVYAIATAAAVGLGTFMPLLGISLAVFVVVDIVVTRRATVTARTAGPTTPAGPRS